MKKRKIQWWIRRVSCRVGAFLSTCLILATMVVPAFASNNASTQKWYVADEAQLTSESGSVVRYLKLTPYVNGAEYTYTGLTGFAQFKIPYKTSNDVAADATYQCLIPVNYPDWWRSNLPLGNFSYVDFSLVSFQSGDYPSGPWTDISSGYLYFLDRSNATYMSYSSSYALRESSNPYTSSVAGDFSFSSPDSPIFFIRAPSGYSNAGLVTAGVSGLSVSVGRSYQKVLISSFQNLSVAPPAWVYDYQVPMFTFKTLANLSSGNLLIGVQGGTTSKYYNFTFKLSFWVDANKLPAGLQVGDEFPANTDAFDDMRDELLKQFPEAAENIENGKTTIQGWNDTETVDTDVASTSISTLNALFQNLGGFLFIVSLMVFGAVCLRMLIKKAVSG